MEKLIWIAIGLYVVASFYTLAENLTGRHVKTRDVSDVARAALEAVGWPLALLPWREWLSSLVSNWRAIEPRYASMP